VLRNAQVKAAAAYVQILKRNQQKKKPGRTILEVTVDALLVLRAATANVSLILGVTYAES
jgi:hypothetical protein